ncbi:MAG: ATPase, T2SS/T4P/T4SS family, partial [Opitutaceae bacterium]
MNNDIRWLTRLIVEAGLLSREQALEMRARHESADLMTFAQDLIDSGLIADVEKLEEIAGLALARSQVGPPAPTSTPFSAHHPESEIVAGRGANGVMPATDIAAIFKLDDEALAAAMRTFLKTTALQGASDLHLSTGARPFIRKHRTLSYISDYVLSAGDALRVNTSLLSEGQKEIFLERKDYDYALALSGTDRYRVNLMFHKYGAAGAYRMVPAETKSLDALGYTKHIATLKKMLSYHNGLILITGPVGSGKTATLA